MADPNDEHRPHGEGELPLPAAAPTEPPPRPPDTRTGTLPGPLPLREGAAPRPPTAPTPRVEAPRRAPEDEVPRPRATEALPLDRALGLPPIDGDGDGESDDLPGPAATRAPAALPEVRVRPATTREDDPRWAPIRGRRSEPVGARPGRSEPTLTFARGARGARDPDAAPPVAGPPEAAVSRSRPEPARAPAAPSPEPTPADPTGAVVRPLVPLVLLLLFEASALPVGGADGLVSPLRLLASPGSATFVAAVFFVLVLVAAAIPVSVRLRAGLLAGLGLGLLGYATVVTGAAVAADVFDGQPALELLFRGPGAPRLVLLLAAVALPTALFWRYLRPASVGARIVAGTALILVLFAYFGLQALGLGDGSPLAQLLAAGREAPFMGDRVAAWLALLPALVALLGLAAFLPGRSRAMGRLSGALFWAAVVVPLVALALFVAPMNAWRQVLEPLKVATLLAAGLLLLPVGLGTLLATFEREGLDRAREAAPDEA